MNHTLGCPPSQCSVFLAWEHPLKSTKLQQTDRRFLYSPFKAAECIECWESVSLKFRFQHKTSSSICDMFITILAMTWICQSLSLKILAAPRLLKLLLQSSQEHPQESSETQSPTPIPPPKKSHVITKKTCKKKHLAQRPYLPSSWCSSSHRRRGDCSASQRRQTPGNSRWWVCLVRRE